MPIVSPIADFWDSEVGHFERKVKWVRPELVGLLQRKLDSQRLTGGVKAFFSRRFNLINSRLRREVSMLIGETWLSSTAR